jgi:hypothetical protein
MVEEGLHRVVTNIQSPSAWEMKFEGGYEEFGKLM